MGQSNNAIYVNGFTNTVYTDNHITYQGSDLYFAITALMMASTFAFVGLAFRKPREQRLFHYITAAITMVASIAYFSMGSNLGWTAIQVEFPRQQEQVAGLYRQIFYVRYIDWFVTTPLLLLDLLLTAGLPAPTIAYTILINEIMIITGLVGALVKSSYKWGYFVFGCFAFFFVAYTVVIEGRSHARALGADIGKTYTLCGVWTIFLWFLYPIAWGLAEGGNVISSDGEAIFYSILDLLAKPVFGGLLIWGHRNIDLERLGLHVKDPAQTGRPGNIGEKRHENPNTLNTTTEHDTLAHNGHNTAATGHAVV